MRDAAQTLQAVTLWTPSRHSAAHVIVAPVAGSLQIVFLKPRIWRWKAGLAIHASHTSGRCLHSGLLQRLLLQLSNLFSQLPVLSFQAQASLL